MHGLTTINQLNENAAHNTPGAPEAAIAAAEAGRAGKLSQFDIDVAAATEARHNADIAKLEVLAAMHPLSW